MDDATSSPQAPRETPVTASAALAGLLDTFPEETLTVGEILDRLEGQAFGLLLLLLALPNCIPNIPGLSTIFGVMMVAPAVQLIFGAQGVWLPGRIKRWRISRDSLRMAIKGALPVLRRIERYVGPRWTFLVAPPFTQFLGLQTLMLAFVLILPIPLGNWPPGMTVAATALALLQKDGRLALLSVVMSAISVVVAWAGVRIGFAALRELGEMIHGAVVAMF
ncbi:MAG: exopolysaccharide biosynthesis protein [Hyphomonadaceae bacterium]|nr:exopolysaccharide biosynthesis protein [Hyphomonadaceae bacterium]